MHGCQRVSPLPFPLYYMTTATTSIMYCDYNEHEKLDPGEQYPECHEHELQIKKKVSYEHECSNR